MKKVNLFLVFLSLSFFIILISCSGSTEKKSSDGINSVYSYTESETGIIWTYYLNEDRTCLLKITDPDGSNPVEDRYSWDTNTHGWVRMTPSSGGASYYIRDGYLYYTIDAAKSKYNGKKVNRIR
ncbi:hypothetical protein [Dysgonomonas sp. 520]|uniref:hypothetical protein n=1 Tax=Dysgonomonas sp. 520 TaxID=2302931 RepID=UPI0013D2E624|nr:hypothetical protein [Dysgonomonas sp. 520]NDW11211.1 hypothetical protein [Dysgonomonas sp. 520]